MPRNVGVDTEVRRFESVSPAEAILLASAGVTLSVIDGATFAPVWAATVIRAFPTLRRSTVVGMLVKLRQDPDVNREVMRSLTGLLSHGWKFENENDLLEALKADDAVARLEGLDW